MRPALLALLTAPLVAHADPSAIDADGVWSGGGAPLPEVPPDLVDLPPDELAQVVGGQQAEPGAWPDAVYLSSGSGACTGTLIHPSWVLTAAHCLGGLREVTLNTIDSGSRFDVQSSDGAEVIAVKREVPYDVTWFDSVDIALVELATPSTKVTPRVIGRDCITEEYLVDGAEVVIVGWGMTQANGTGPTSFQQEGVATIATADCSADQIDGIATGCTTVGGEIGAGGDGVDACFGDSGGPLYLPTPRGTYVVGATSRSYAGVSFAFPCRDGGIWSRPDYVMEWIEATIGEELPHPNCNPVPEVSPEPVELPPGGKRTRPLGVSDPDAPGLTFEVVRQPLHGRVTVDGRGVYTIAADPSYAGIDSFVVRVSQELAAAPWPDSPPGSVDVVVPVRVTEGCEGCDAGPRGGVGWLPWLGLAALRRRRG